MDNIKTKEGVPNTTLINRNLKLVNLILDNKVIIFAFLFSLIYMNVVYFLNHVVPFGDDTILRMDLYHQYGPMFSELVERAGFGNGTFTYSWYTGLGSPFYGNYYNYLAGPFSFLAVFFGNLNVTEAIAFIIMIKGAFSSAFFCYFLKRMYKITSFYLVGFSLLYSACGYFLAYYWNVMWIDGMVWLPLIFLGINLMITEKKSMLYVVSLAVLMFSNYYIASMVCMASMLYLFVAFTTNYNSKIENGVKHFFGSFLRFGVSSAFAGGLAAFALIPIYFVLQSSSATKGTFPTNFETYFTFLDFLSSHLASVETTIRSSGENVLPNVYSGILSLILVPLYIFNSAIPKREKASNILFLLFMYISFNCNILNYIWHGLHFPNDLPFRFSFIYSFIFILMAFRTFMNLQYLTLKQIAGSVIGVFAFVCVVEVMPTNKTMDYTIMANILLIAMYAVYFVLYKSKNILSKKQLSFLITVVVLLELCCSTPFVYNISVNRDGYTSDKRVVQALVDKLNTDDESFYRLELAESMTHNDPAWYLYNGVSAFSSMAYEPVAKLSDKLGLDTNRINSFRYYMQTPAYNAMVSLKYFLTEKQFDDTDMYTSLFGSGEYYVYQNNYYLPVAFATDDAILEWDTAPVNPFLVQEDFYKKALNNNDNIFDEAIIKAVTGNNCSPNNPSLTLGATSYSASGGSNPTIDVVLSTEKRQHMYVYVSSSQIDSMTIKKGEFEENQSFSDARIIDLGMCEANQSITVTLKAKNADSGSYTMYAYGVNDNMKSAIDKLSSNGLNVSYYDDTNIKGTVNVEKDGLLYTSIPYDKGWSCYVDGVKAELVSIGNDALCAFDIKAGSHEIHLEYQPQGFKLGMIISLSTLFLIISLFAISIIRKRVVILKSKPKETYEMDLNNLSIEDIDLLKNSINAKNNSLINFDQNENKD